MKHLQNVIGFVRSIHINSVLGKNMTVNNLKGKSVSSQHWLTRQLKDPYIEMAKMLNYRWGKI